MIGMLDIDDEMMMRMISSHRRYGHSNFSKCFLPLVDLDGAVEVGLDVAWRLSSIARSPVAHTDCPHSQSRESAVEFHIIGISSGSVGDDALAALLVPVVLGAPGGNILNILGGSALAALTPSGRTVSATVIGENQGDKKNQDCNFHDLKKLLITT